MDVSLQSAIVHILDIQVGRSWVDEKTYALIVLDFSIFCSQECGQVTFQTDQLFINVREREIV
jgi:hypothetical protein